MTFYTVVNNRGKLFPLCFVMKGAPEMSAMNTGWKRKNPVKKDASNG